MLDERALSTLYLLSELRLADLTDRTILGRFEIAGDISTGPPTDYPTSQEWAARLRTSGFGGIFYVARHDVSFAERSVALFGSMHADVKLFETRTEALPEEVIQEACREFGFSVLPGHTLW